MALEPLATAAQLADRMTTTVPPERAEAALVDASAAVRAATGQVFNRLTTTDVLRPTMHGVLHLPQRPVREVFDVTEATLDGPIAVEFIWDGSDRIDLSSWAGRLSVTYEHGYDDGDMPDDVVAVVCNVAARALGTPRENAGMTQESITNYSASFGAIGAAGPVGLFEDERNALGHYRRRLGWARTGWR